MEDVVTKEKTIYITDHDLNRLRRLLDSKGRLEGRDQQYLRDLKQELDRAVVVAATDIPPNVVTMNSRVSLRDLDTDELAEYTLVFPGSADIRRGRLSVLAPIGTALLGCQEFDTIEWKVPVGVKRFRIDRILYQPEAAEAYHL